MDTIACLNIQQLKYRRELNGTFVKADMNTEILMNTGAIFVLSNLYLKQVMARCMPWLISFARSY